METPIAELLAGYALGDLTPEEQTILEAYLESHPEARQEIVALEQTLSLLPLASPAPARPLGVVVMAASVVLLTIGSLFLTWQNQQMRQKIANLQETIQFPDNRLIALKAADHNDQSIKGSLIISPTMAQGILAIQNLASPPPGTKYTLWIVDERGNKVFCQKFYPDRQGRVMITVPIDRAMVNTSKVVVTIEQVSNQGDPRGPMVMQGTDL